MVISLTPRRSLIVLLTETNNNNNKPYVIYYSCLPFSLDCVAVGVKLRWVLIVPLFYESKSLKLKIATRQSIS